jgi:transaldolase
MLLCLATQAMLDEALYLAELFDSKGVDTSRRLYVSLPATWPGLQACRLLQRQGIDCSIADVVSFAQAAAAAEAGAAVVAPAVGLLSSTQQQQQPGGREDAGVALAKRVYKYYKRFGYSSAVMPAGFSSVAQIRALAGCDKLSISAALMAQLAGSDVHLPKVLWPSMGGCRERQQAQQGLDEDWLVAGMAQEQAQGLLQQAVQEQVEVQEALEAQLAAQVAAEVLA